ncbi:shikimate dehydrogenase [bacterium]|nr:shikimate dehydrogenase [bacterium]NIN91990.1 shikimate dehydrogenase [bacterium]NIO73180.1 shikimate dehydrogenase [bacterium]
MKPSGSTKIVRLIGYPVEHSKSPLMHNAAFQSLGLDFVYNLFSVKPSDLKEAITGLRAPNVAGANVTIPYKEEVMKYLDEISPEAEFIGAVNTIHNRQGRLGGYNTDGQGFITSLLTEGRIKLEGQKALLLGAGGAGKAVAVKLTERGVERLAITDKIAAKGEDLVGRLRENIPDCPVYAVAMSSKEFAETVFESTLLVNATPVGMKEGDPCVIDPEYLHKDLFIYDVIYNRETPLVAEAKKRGLKALGGIGMLIYQGAASFEIWTGQRAPVEVMRKKILEELSSASI